MKLLEKAMEAVFPTSIYCICCGAVIDQSRTYALCDNCADKLSWVEGHTCAKCGKILDADNDRSLCHDCSSREHFFDKGYTCAQYGLYERALMMDLKYRDKSYLARKIGAVMADRIAMEDIDVDAVVPVPVHRKRLDERGYNQAELIAAPVAERLGKPLLPQALKRIVSTSAMKDLGKWERIENARHAFAVSASGRRAVECRRILLVDDIYTTGATLDACAKVLLEAGACAVDVYTFAAGGDRHPQGRGRARRSTGMISTGIELIV
ncbi:MAG: ComF family protein [Anaerovoracaceae bacterium]